MSAIDPPTNMPGESGPESDPDASSNTGSHTGPAAESSATGDSKIRCDACPVLCNIRPGRTGACDRYGNQNGKLVRT
ncbi:MAG: hypothetical protein KDJ99_01060, partial [Candidatus Competibacteraceae bacterium]|nr:hypothetical protein [Candidatus Competibacteraceae bacterium]